MIRLTKAHPPDYLAQRVKEWTEELLAAVDAGDEATRRRVEKRYNYSQIREALLAETHGKCAYCESRIGALGYPRIDHIMPRKEAPELTFAWDNLTIACERCNGNKGDYWNVEMPVLNPYIDEPLDFIWFPDNWVRPWNDAPRGEFSIALLDLNRDDLLEWRRLRLLRIMDLINRWRDAATEGERQGYWRALEIEMRSDKEYLAMVRGIVRGHARTSIDGAESDAPGVGD